MNLPTILYSERRLYTYIYTGHGGPREKVSTAGAENVCFDTEKVSSKPTTVLSIDRGLRNISLHSQ